MPEQLDIAVACRGVTRDFGRCRALDQVDWEVRRGEFHALLGENGAGKSTLVRIISGEVRADEGEVLILGTPPHSPSEAHRLGLRMVHQHLSLIPALTVAENFILEQDAPERVPDLRALEKSIEARAAAFDLPLRASSLVGDLSMSERQWLEILRAICLGGEILILDEPTSLLSPVEGDRLLSQVREIAHSGKTVILITHKLREVYGHADRVTVLRRGRRIQTLSVPETTPEQLTSLIVGPDPGIPPPRSKLCARTPRPPENLLEIRGLRTWDSRGNVALDQVDLSLSRGTVCGVAGVAGNGQTELAEIVAGVDRPFAGLLEEPAGHRIVRRYVPADRQGIGTGAHLSLLENLVLRVFDSPEVAPRKVLRPAKLREIAETLAREFSIKMQSLSQSPSSLSGGNLQRLVLARELSGPIDLLVVHNPTSGLDIATSAFVRSKLAEAATRGAAVLLISDDLDELLELSDRILVLHNKRVVGSLSRDEADLQAIGALMTGRRDVAPPRVAGGSQLCV